MKRIITTILFYFVAYVPIWPCIYFILLNKIYSLHLRDTTEFKCYVHPVLPLKKSGHTSYFKCSLQTKTNIYRGVCFANEKQETLQVMQKQILPVKKGTTPSTLNVVHNMWWWTNIPPLEQLLLTLSSKVKNTLFQFPHKQTLDQNSLLLLKDTRVIYVPQRKS